MKTAVKIKDNIFKVVTHASTLLQQEREHSDSDKNIYWVFFDKDHKPYWIVDEFNFESTNYRTNIYTVNENSKTLSVGDVVATQDFQVIDDIADLDYIEIKDDNSFNKKIGSTLVDLFEYISFVNGAKFANGVAVSFRDSKMNQKNLIEFYKRKKYTVEELVENETATFEKDLDPVKIKNIATSIITVKKDNLAFKILIPDNLKKQVVELIKNEQNLNQNKTLNKKLSR